MAFLSSWKLSCLLRSKKSPKIKITVSPARIGKLMKITTSAVSLFLKHFMAMIMTESGHHSAHTEIYVSIPHFSQLSRLRLTPLAAWLSTDISYGLFLADHNTLDIIESELVILPAIMCQGLVPSTKWHLRGCLRVGCTREEVECIQQVIEHIAKTCGKQLQGLPRVSDIPTDEM